MGEVLLLSRPKHPPPPSLAQSLAHSPLQFGGGHRDLCLAQPPAQGDPC